MEALAALRRGMGTMKLEELRRLSMRLEQADFALEHPWPQFVPVRIVEGELQDGRRGAGATLIHDAVLDQAVSLKPNRVVRVHKSSHSGGLAVRQYIVGRGAEADITLADYTISKLHARLTVDTRGRVERITDLQSTNGTWVDRKRLPAGGSARIESGQEVRFGRLELVYLDAKGLWEYLRDAKPFLRF